MADALGSGPSESNLMQVQLLLSAPKEKTALLLIFKTSLKIFSLVFSFLATKRNSHFIGELVATLLRSISLLVFLSRFCSFSKQEGT